MTGLLIGSLGASLMHDVIAKGKNGAWLAGRANVEAQLIQEIITNQAAPSFSSAAMEWGVQTEPDARAAYEFLRDVDCVQTDPIPHPRIKGAHASPDGLIGSDGLIEVKCPNTATHIDTLLNGTIAARYRTQMQWQMCVTARQWCDFVSFDPRMPASMQIWIHRIERNDKLISELEEQVQEFLAELDAKVKALREKYEAKEMAA